MASQAWRWALGVQGAALACGLAAWRVRGSREERDARAPPSQQNELSVSRVQRAARDVVRSTRALGMVCCSTGDAPPTCRLMDLHWPDDERMRLHLITKPWTRKAGQLKEAADKVTITFHDHRESGENSYASLSGRVRPLVELAEREAAWKGTWGFFHERACDASVIWEFVPQQCEVVNHRWQVAPSWRAATLLRRPTGDRGDALWKLET